MERYICIHGHFYQPPRENPWLEAIELEDSAYPFHDWNERISAECYEQNVVARILDRNGRIEHIMNNYARISFDFGPTLLNWLKINTPETYQAIVDADRESQERFAGHGSALAHVYSHIIMPLANHRDRVTQVVWGIQDFVHRFGRDPEGMWLAETAVDLETLDILAEHGIRFTILAPSQANRVRTIDGGEWQDVSENTIDPTRAYRHVLPSGRTIALFFYDMPIANTVAFGNVLQNGERFARRLMAGFDTSRTHAQLVHIATDGECYGHHYHNGQMALAYAIHTIEEDNQADLINYGAFLENCPPEYEVEIKENTAWSCSHGVGRWYYNCGCNSGKFPSWNQEWRGPMREALDCLRDKLAPLFEERAGALLYEPWAVRNAYIAVMLDRSQESIAAFLNKHALHTLNNEEQIESLRLLEMQRQLLLMYNSCGWFFDEITGPEAVQSLQYAGRVLHLARQILAPTQNDTFATIEHAFLDILEQAKSNLPEHRDGRHIFEKRIRPSEVDLERVAAHYAVSSLFGKYAAHPDTFDIYCYHVQTEDYHRFEPGMSRVAIGRARITSAITLNTQEFSFGVLHFGEHNLNAGVRTFDDDEAYRTLVEGTSDSMSRGDIAEAIRLLDGYFHGLGYSVHSLFRDEQRTFLDLMLESTLADDESMYRQIYERRTSLMYLLTSLNAPLPRTLHATAEFVINSDLRHALAEIPPDVEQVRSILERSRMWDIELDTAGFAYALQQTMEHLSNDIRDRPDDRAIIQNLEAVVEVAHFMPFEVDFWKIQNTYYEILNTVYVEMQERVDEGDEDARLWDEQFITLGDKLGVKVSEMQNVSSAHTIAAITQDVLESERIPHATYRFQLNPNIFTFHHAQEVVAYLEELGVSDCYISPIFKARAGSTHGYDVCDHTHISPVLGGEEAFQAFNHALRSRNMGVILDIVPNHMGIGDVCNALWMDVLENGPSSAYATYFDIEWHPVKPELHNKVLLPILGDQYGRILESGQLQLTYEDGSFSIRYYEHCFPVAPGTYSHILAYGLEALENVLEPENEFLQEYKSILTAISYLPPRTERDQDKINERYREKEVIKRRITHLYHESEDIRAEIDNAVQAFNGVVGTPRSFDLLDELIEAQPYRLAFWRVAAEEINYRRFFDINELAAIRTEDSEVFRHTHAYVFQLLTEGAIHGLRIDHIDGLFDPAGYFQQLQESFVFHQVRNRLAKVRPTMPEDAVLANRVAGRMRSWVAERSKDESRIHNRELSWPLYVVAEKILSTHETLPQNWALHGTTGYDFLYTVNNLFVCNRNEEIFDSIYAQFTKLTIPFQQMVNTNKKMIMLVSMDSEIYALSHQLERIAERNRRYRDFTLNTLTFALREVIACLSVYRTYTTETATVLQRDRHYIEEAVNDAIRRNPRTAAEVFNFIRETLLLTNMSDFQPEDQEPLLQWVRKFQQLSGPIMAKGVEDTSFYVYNRLVSLNEVGGHPDHFGIPLSDFHEKNKENQRFWPHTMLASSTHDTKRSEDVRARINVLSEMPDEWQAALERWQNLNGPKKATEEDRQGKPLPVPDRNDEYLLYQTLIGAWPAAHALPEHTVDAPATWNLLLPSDEAEWDDFRNRIIAYMQKATKEAKVHTSWVQPNQGYDEAMQGFIRRILCSANDDPFIQDMREFAQHIAFFGQWNALSQTVLKLTAPGVPDIYQGNELWDLSLVDPDNRRPVDFALRRTLLSDIKQKVDQQGQTVLPLTQELLQTSQDGRIKLYLTYRLLQYRRVHDQLFALGTYLPLNATGEHKANVCAFARMMDDEALVVLAPRLLSGLTGGVRRLPLGTDVWGATWLELPEEEENQTYRHLFTGEVLTVGTYKGAVGLSVGEMCHAFPVAVLERVPTDE